MYFILFIFRFFKTSCFLHTDFAVLNIFLYTYRFFIVYKYIYIYLYLYLYVYYHYFTLYIWLWGRRQVERVLDRNPP